MRIILAPFSILYGLIVRLRNVLFDRGILRATAYDLAVISVGNIALGGSGKTPLIEYLIHLLIPTCTVSVLSRGYGRHTHGLLEVSPAALSTEAGDEPCQLKQKFPGVTVVVSEDRRKGMTYLLSKHASGALKPHMVLLDDAFQHRWVKAGLNVVLVEYSEVAKRRRLVPAGNYREGINALERAQAVILTKITQDVSSTEIDVLRTKLNVEEQTPLFLSGIDYMQPVAFGAGHGFPKAIQTIFLITGIAKPQTLVAYLESQGHTVIHHAYGDHHEFSPKEVRKWISAFEGANEPKVLMTTEKDAQRLKNTQFESELKDLPLYYIPIKVKVWGSISFDSFIIDYVRAASKNR